MNHIKTGKDTHHLPFWGSILFLLIPFIEAGIFFFLIYGKWIVGGHDGFEYFNLQYCFLNNVVNCGEIPQWMPFIVQGMVVPWWHIMQGGILQNILLLSGGLLKGINFLPLFYLGIYIDELLLLVGVWLLARRFYSSNVTVCFVALSIMGSCIWLLQPWWNFHFYYAIPLILYFAHKFLDSGKWRYYFLAGNLLFIQSFGNLPYFLPVTSLVIFLYFMFSLALSHKSSWRRIKTVHFGWPFVFATSSILLMFGLLYVFMHYGTDQIVNYTLRRQDASSSLSDFLFYGGRLSWRIWLELILGVSFGIDYTLYIGIICIPLIILGIMFGINGKNAHFFLTVAVLLLFSMGTFVSVFFYYCWPMMKYFRHLALVSPIIKIFLCFMAGFGFEAVYFNRPRQVNPIVKKVALITLSALMLSAAVCLLTLALHYPDNYKFFVDLVEKIVPRYLPVFETLFSGRILPSLLVRTAIFALGAAILLVILPFVNPRKIIPLMAVLVVLHGVDIYSFKLAEMRLKTAPLNDKLYKMVNFQPLSFPKRRDVVFSDSNPRTGLLKALPIQYGIFYWTVYQFLFKDELGSSFKTDYWLRPLDEYMKAYWGQPIHDLSVPPRGFHYPSFQEHPRLEFPQSNPAALKISGVTEDKIQFFSQAEVISSDDVIASDITMAGYKGDMIFLSPLGKAKMNDAISLNQSGASGIDLSADTRLLLPYQVRRFDCNNLEVSVDIQNRDSAWLFYSDVWHPHWRATVNGKEVPVYRANLAYKAVKLEKGLNDVHFFFKSAWVALFYKIIGLNSLFWLMMIILLAGRILFCQDCTNIKPAFS